MIEIQRDLVDLVNLHFCFQEKSKLFKGLYKPKIDPIYQLLWVEVNT